MDGNGNACGSDLRHMNRVCKSIHAWSVFALVGSFGNAHAQMVAAAPEPKLTNAASTRYGARVRVEAGPGAVKDKQTTPDAYLDGNVHTRCVLTGTPYTITLQLPFKIAVEKLSFALGLCHRSGAQRHRNLL